MVAPLTVTTAVSPFLAPFRDSVEAVTSELSPKSDVTYSSTASALVPLAGLRSSVNDVDKLQHTLSNYMP